MQSKPLVSIITVNWNTTAVTCELLSSIATQNTYPNIEVVVADNASSQDPTELLTSVYPEVKIVRNEKNLGFSGGNNAGIAASSGEYLFLVNNDTEFTPGLIESLLEVFAEKQDAGIVCPKFHYFFKKGTIEYAGYSKVNVFTGRNRMIGMGETDQGQYNNVCSTNYAHGGAMMVSRSVLKKVGLLPELFFLYYEEFDWSVCFRKAGYKVYVQPNALIYHKESMTTGKASPLKTFYLTRNRILFMRRNVPMAGLSIFITYFLLFTIPKNSFMFLIRKQKDHFKSFWNGIFWHFNKNITFQQK